MKISSLSFKTHKMLHTIVIAITFSAVLNEATSVDLTNFNKRNETLTTRIKRQEDRWSWGIVDVAAPRTTQGPTTTTTTVTNQPDDPCSPLVVEPPDFRAQGRSLSEEKCMKYIWDSKQRIETKNRVQKCKQKRRKHGNGGHAVGGRSTYNGEFPHMGAIGWLTPEGAYAFKCGASLISSKFVLTAAHCTRASDRDSSIADPLPKIVRLGDKNIKKENRRYQQYTLTDVNILRIIVHPSYNPPKKYFDIALMELESEVTFGPRIQPACLWPRKDTTELGSVATLTGWGVTEVVTKTITPELQAADVDIVDPQTCDDLLKNSCNRLWCGLQENQICAGKLAGGVDACQGDSGGPLQMKINMTEKIDRAIHYIIGVTSFGIGCAKENTPGIYTRVSSFIEWIDGIVWAQ